MAEIRLKVMEALREEAYKGIVRIDSETMREIGVRVGDIVEIEGSRKTIGIVDRAYPTDVGQPVIRMDGILRRNAKTGIGEMVSVHKADVQEAKKVVIAPAQKGVTIRVDARMFKRGLLGRAVMRGDILALGGTTSRRRTLSESPFFDDVFPRDLFEEFMGVGSFGMSSLKFVVADTTPKDAVIITEATQLEIKSRAVEVIEEKIPDVAYEDIGGLTDEIVKVRELVELPLKHPELFERLGIEPPKGVLLHGPPGCGKTLLAKAVANESDANFVLVNGPEIISKFVGEAEKKIRQIFDEAEKKSPSIIFIDEIDAIASKREESQGEVEKRVVAQLLTVLDGLKSRGKVVVIAATNRPNAVDPALRRPGRFDREIIIGVPDKKARHNILKIHTRNMPLKDVRLKRWADKTHGFVGADLSALCKEAALNVVRRILPHVNLKKNGSIPKEILEKLIIHDKDFESAMKLVTPSAMREIFIETPSVTWKEVGGLESTKRELKEAVEWPLKHGAGFKRLGIRAPKGILLHGPPGCGKTLLAKAVANESEANFILVKGPELLNKFLGESEKGMRKIFKKARLASPAIIFFDEVESIASKRTKSANHKVNENLVNTFLAEMDGLEELNDVVVIAATNRLDMMDSALLRPGRFDRKLFVPRPDEKAREQIFKIHTKAMPLASDVRLKVLVEKTKGYVGSDVEAICREAGMLALRESFSAKEVFMNHFEEALLKVKSSVRDEDAEKYRKLGENLPTVRSSALGKGSYFG
jgi:transitional endoplasmic reticulum ATPase